MLEPQLCKIERADEDVDRADRVVQPDIVLDPGRKQVGLLAAIAALERANRHKPNRTLKAPKCPSFLPSLDVLICRMSLALPKTPNQPHIRSIPSRNEGRIAIVTD